VSASSFIAKRISSTTGGKLGSLIIRLAVVSTALCVAVMIITSALLRGFKSEISEKIFGFWGHVHIAATQSGDGLFEAVPFSKDAGWIDSLRNLKGAVPYSATVKSLGFGESSNAGVRKVQTYIVKPGVIQTKDEIEGILLKGAGDDFEWSFFKKYLRDGKLPDLSDSTESRMVILSEQTAARVNLRVGDPFLVHFPEGREMRKLRFEVGGLYRTGLEEYDTQFAIVDQRVLQRILKWTPDQVSGVELILEDVDDLAGMSAHVYFDIVPPNIYAESVRERFPGIFEWLDLQDLNEYVIIGLMLLVSVINMLTTLLILILERSNMVGVLRTLGMSGKSLQNIFLRFGLRVLLRGLFWGNLIGLGLSFIQKWTGIISLSEENYYLSTAPISINWWMWIALNVGTVLVVMGLLLIPAMFVTRIDPVKTIRFD
jgi:lipoprotein-releasing system permease protein